MSEWLNSLTHLLFYRKGLNIAMTDVALTYLTEALNYCDQYVEVSLADMMFEAEGNKDVNEHNEKVTKGAFGALKNAVKSLIDMIKKAINGIKDFIATRGMSKEEKEKFDEFKKLVASDPELADTKVTLADFKAYEEAYDAAIKELEAEAKKPNPSEEVANKIIEKLGKTLDSVKQEGSDMAKRAAVATTLQTAVDIADRNVMAAKAIKLMLDSELVTMEDIDSVLGEGESAKQIKKIEKYAKGGIFHRLKIKLLYRKSATLKAVLKKQMNTILSYTNIKNGKVKDGKSVIDAGSIAKGAIKHPKLTSQVVGGADKAADIAMNAGLLAVKAHGAKKDIKKTKKDVEDLKNFITG